MRIPSPVSLLREPRYRTLREIAWFTAVTLLIHFGYRYWSAGLDFRPVAGFMAVLQETLTDLVFRQSSWINAHILGLQMEVTGRTMTFPNTSWILVNASCAGDKQILQFMILLLVSRGSWKNKGWFIPLGMLILHGTNVLRIVLLSIVSVNMPQYWHLAHNTVLRGMFYVVILILWIIWTERISPAKTQLTN